MGQHHIEEPIPVYFGTTVVAVAVVEDLGETAVRLKKSPQENGFEEKNIAKAST